MAYGTHLFTNIYYPNKTYTDLSEVKHDLEHVIETKKYLEDELKILVFMTEPSKFCSEDDDPISFLNLRYGELLEEYNDYVIKEYQLNMLIDDWEKCHDSEGNPIKFPDSEYYWEKRFIDGDFL